MSRQDRQDGKDDWSDALEARRTYDHVASADAVDEPFDWGEHTESVTCFCNPEVNGALVIHHREATENWNYETDGR
jgi:hypothetical protein